MINSINIRRANVDDAQLLSDLSIITFIETYRGSGPDEDLLHYMDHHFSAPIIFEELLNKDDHYYIAFVNDFPAGYMRLKEDYDEFPLAEEPRALQLKRIYVLHEFQNKKIGAALMRFALDLAAESNYQILWLGVWERNSKAINFYKRWGFEFIQLYQFQFGETVHTDHWMVKEL